MDDDLRGAAVELENSSIVGRLLDEISWEGNAKTGAVGAAKRTS